MKYTIAITYYYKYNKYYLQTVIVDCRPFIDYNLLHIRYAINAFYSKMMRRRVYDNKVSDSFCIDHVAILRSLRSFVCSDKNHLVDKLNYEEKKNERKND